MMTVTQQDLDHAKKVGQQGGFVNTNGMHHEDAAKLGHAVRQGQQGK